MHTNVYTCRYFDDGETLPPHCQFGYGKACDRFGEDCRYNHMPYRYRVLEAVRQDETITSYRAYMRYLGEPCDSDNDDSTIGTSVIDLAEEQDGYDDDDGNDDDDSNSYDDEVEYLTSIGKPAPAKSHKPSTTSTTATLSQPPVSSVATLGAAPATILATSSKINKKNKSKIATSNSSVTSPPVRSSHSSQTAAVVAAAPVLAPASGRRKPTHSSTSAKPVQAPCSLRTSRGPNAASSPSPSPAPVQPTAGPRRSTRIAARQAARQEAKVDSPKEASSKKKCKAAVSIRPTPTRRSAPAAAASKVPRSILFRRLKGSTTRAQPTQSAQSLGITLSHQSPLTYPRTATTTAPASDAVPTRSTGLVTRDQRILSQPARAIPSWRTTLIPQPHPSSWPTTTPPALARATASALPIIPDEEEDKGEGEDGEESMDSRYYINADGNWSDGRGGYNSEDFDNIDYDGIMRAQDYWNNYQYY